MPNSLLLILQTPRGKASQSTVLASEGRRVFFFFFFGEGRRKYGWKALLNIYEIGRDNI